MTQSFGLFFSYLARIAAHIFAFVCVPRSNILYHLRWRLHLIVPVETQSRPLLDKQEEVKKWVRQVSNFLVYQSFTTFWSDFGGWLLLISQITIISFLGALLFRSRSSSNSDRIKRPK